MTPILQQGVDFAARFAAAKDRLPGAGLPWLASAREKASTDFERQGPPRSRRADWRFTPVDAVLGTDFEPAGRPKSHSGFAGKALCPLTFHRLVLGNGRLLPERSRYCDLPAGVSVSSLAQALQDDPGSLREDLGRDLSAEGLPFACLAAALFGEGVVVRVARGARLDRPLHLLLACDDTESGRPQMAHLRLVIILEPGASLELIEESLGGGRAPFWTNLLTTVRIGAGAGLKHYRLQRENALGSQTSATLVELGRGSRYESHAFSFGGALLRADLRVRLAAEGAQCSLNGLCLVRGTETADHHTVVEHAAAGGITRELYKAILDERGRFVFDGMVHVKPGAQKTDASLYNKNLLLCDDADVHSNPEFRIFADDVSCKHGGAIGRLSSEAMFYLRSRGIGASDARRMLVYAFGSEMIERVSLEPLRESLMAALHARMPEAAEETA
ncbi:MAG: Fe-S cluster assembly protein SufD [Elusimicrobia bacterium GWC2_65_9]|nr:MAG: Fe-S cluster assembly protein SufD [Elusimicrobia bacterium GWA2_66_18]OGR77250.1 MAG: Fe-S cluster assembly protein SufD [Elusimicrobia bacterium GWC2_65_9]